jgi:hypothetical protein
VNALAIMPRSARSVKQIQRERCMTAFEMMIAAGTLVATAFGGYATWRTASIARTQKELAQRQAIFQLWDRIASLRPIDPKDPVPMHVHNALSTMELIGLCCEGGMVDADVIKRTMTDRYIELFDMVKGLGKIPTMENKTGMELLQQNPAAMNFYDVLMDEKKRKNALKKV